MPAGRSHELARAIESGGVLDALRAAGRLRRLPAARVDPRPLLGIVSHGDVLARAAAGYALGRVPGAAVDRALLALLETGNPTLREAAALSLSERRPWSPALPALGREAAAGGFGGMLAQLALDEWSRDGLDDAPPVAPARLRAAGPGLRVAQVVLQGRIDAGLRAAGAGDGGGLATLVVHLSKALGRRPEIDHVATITRAFADEYAEASHELRHEPIDERSSIHRVAFGPDRYLATAEMWPHRREAERALERTLRLLLPLDVVHLRFADVGTFAAARVCRRLGIPVCFTLAADPHVVIRAAERSGTLSRETFTAADGRDHLLFRAHLVETMLGQADGLVAFPRQEGESDLHDLLGIDRGRGSGRGIRTVAEGVSLRTLDRAASGTGAEPASWPDLRAAIGNLPRSRAGLPLLVSVGRFHRVKGLHRLLEAWAGDPELFAAFNLAVVGGNLEHPTEEERGVIRSLREVGRRHPWARDGLLLLGHRSHDAVAELLHAARSGTPDAVAANGIYACASDKEEFGLALLEALAVGLPVAAPRTGGPRTYVEDGVTGALVDTTSIGDLRRGLREAASLREDETRAARAAALVRSRFSIDVMAAQLTRLYAELAGVERLEEAA
ncbi:MAG: group 1 glycosyl transferase [Gaiellaceae bacterium]|nr:group 1 glycosyl transferase [Gaiellaceae bacterium]